ncbi:Polyamine oxidase 5 [Heracleum sosnowskyi]|uniref:Polyamine oxidase 5 n=1 Tax=Heracleum sosnowskyi TaxID=360622 RepID=A0AAD8MMC4_9APIA|nr:Polyamine oxidase 5 [Heracleum sosnowskyi]
MEQTAKNKRGFSFPEAAGKEQGFAGKRPKTPASQEEDEGDMLAWLNMDDETAIELSKLLDTEFVSSTPFRVKFSCTPYSSPEIFQASASYITINSNSDESCGSSFSESDSSVMASVDLGCLGFDVWRCGVVDHGGAWGDVEVARESVEGGVDCGQMEGGDCGYDFDDDMLARFLGEDFVGPD